MTGPMETVSFVYPRLLACRQAHLGGTRVSGEEQSDPAERLLVKRHFLVSRRRCLRLCYVTQLAGYETLNVPRGKDKVT